MVNFMVERKGTLDLSVQELKDKVASKGRAK